jgi:hypothetical protein
MREEIKKNKSRKNKKQKKQSKDEDEIRYKNQII